MGHAKQWSMLEGYFDHLCVCMLSLSAAGCYSDMLHSQFSQLSDQPIDRPTHLLTDWTTHWPNDRPLTIDRPTYWLTKWPIDRPTDWLTHWPTDRPTDWTTHWPTDIVICMCAGCRCPRPVATRRCCSLSSHSWVADRLTNPLTDRYCDLYVCRLSLSAASCYSEMLQSQFSQLPKHLYHRLCRRLTVAPPHQYYPSWCAVLTHPVIKVVLQSVLTVAETSPRQTEPTTDSCKLSFHKN